MDIGKAFSYVFEDPEWIKKVLIGGIVGIIPIVNFALMGYVIQTARNVAVGHDRPLPDWGNFGEFFTTGLKYFVISLVFTLPALLVNCISQVITAGSTSGNVSEEAAAGIAVVALVLACLNLVLSLAGTFLSMASVIKLTETNDLGASLKIGEIIAYTRTNLSQVLTLWLMYIVMGIVGGLGIIAFCIGIIFTIPYAAYMFGHVLGQTVRQQGSVAPAQNFTQF